MGPRQPPAAWAPMWVPAAGLAAGEISDYDLRISVLGAAVDGDGYAFRIICTKLAARNWALPFHACAGTGLRAAVEEHLRQRPRL
jgi:hypothetical protein